MGINTSQLQAYSVYKQTYNWVRISSLGYCTLVYDIQSCTKGQLYQTSIETLVEQIERYQFRKENQQFLVGVHNIKSQKQEFLCNGATTVTVITERIPYRLSDMGQVNFQEGLYVIYQLLNAVMILYEELGTRNHRSASKNIPIDESLVCVNQRGQVKYWLNEKLYKNSIESACDNDCVTEQGLVRQIFALIQSRMDLSHGQEYFRQKGKNIPQFFISAIDFVQEVRKSCGKIRERVRVPTSQNNSETLNQKKVKGEQKKRQSIQFSSRKETLVQNKKLEGYLSQKKMSTKRSPKKARKPPLPPKSAQSVESKQLENKDAGKLFNIQNQISLNSIKIEKKRSQVLENSPSPKFKSLKNNQKNQSKTEQKEEVKGRNTDKTSLKNISPDKRAQNKVSITSIGGSSTEPHSPVQKNRISNNFSINFVQNQASNVKLVKRADPKNKFDPNQLSTRIQKNETEPTHLPSSEYINKPKINFTFKSSNQTSPENTKQSIKAFGGISNAVTSREISAKQDLFKRLRGNNTDGYQNF